MDQDNIQWAIGANDFCSSCNRFFSDPNNRWFIQKIGMCASCDHLQTDQDKEDYDNN